MVGERKNAIIIFAMKAADRKNGETQTYSSFFMLFLGLPYGLGLNAVAHVPPLWQKIEHIDFYMP